MMGKRKGFTLVELLVVIGVITILVGMLIPRVEKAKESARRTSNLSSLRAIAMAYQNYSADDVDGRSIDLSDGNRKGVEWALILARGGYLNDPHMYCFAGDSGASKIVKNTIVDGTLNDNDAWGGGECEFSVYVVSGIPADAPSSTTPIAFTRGIPSAANDLRNSGDGTKVAKWPEDGVYGSRGGQIVYLDNHVKWYDDLGGTGEAGKLVAWNGDPTNDIAKTIPSSAYILNAKGDVTIPGTGNTDEGE
ncbi:MAG: type II secretion system GspH family protein [Puniceicoccales bacterium]|jgi:prepilin-type N-terminal cleavage/methylation domain-containing protein|nr:type II secretion system GspH family protein [Puniceicoccales bacterium]